MATMSQQVAVSSSHGRHDHTQYSNPGNWFASVQACGIPAGGKGMHMRGICGACHTNKAQLLFTFYKISQMLLKFWCCSSRLPDCTLRRFLWQCLLTSLPEIAPWLLLWVIVTHGPSVMFNAVSLCVCVCVCVWYLWSHLHVELWCSADSVGISMPFSHVHVHVFLFWCTVGL